MTVRLRVALAAALVILLAAAALGTAVVLLAGRDVADARDRALRERAVAIEQLAVTAPALVTRPGALETPLTGASTSVELVDRNGAIVARSSALLARPLPRLAVVDAVLRGGAPRYATVDVAGRALRVFAAPLPVSAAAPLGGGALIVAASADPGDETVHRLRGTVIVTAAIVALLAGLLAALTTRRALAPLTNLSAAAAGIARTRDASRRLPASGADDEVGALAGTLNEMLTALERAQAAERRFVADVSHELRTPLTALRGNALHAAAHGADPALLADLAADAERLARLVDDLLALAREGAGGGATQVVHLDEIAAAIAEREPRVTVDDSEPVPVSGDRDALARAVGNLVANALTHGPAGGRVTLRARRAGALATITVEDEGPGPPPAAAAHLFERFWRGAGSADRPGSGLGLAIVRATAERHGGTVRVAGSAFTIELPALGDPSEPGGRTEGAASVPREGT